MRYNKQFVWKKLSEKQKLQVMLLYETVNACVEHAPIVVTKAQWQKGMILAIGRYIYECKTKELCTGLYTKAAIDNIMTLGKSKAKSSPEHAYGSHNSATKLRDVLQKTLQKNPNLSFKEFLKLVIKYCFYNYSTSHENHIVKPLVDSGCDWITAYYKKGIKLYFVVFEQVGTQQRIKETYYMGPAKLRKHFAY